MAQEGRRQRSYGCNLRDVVVFVLLNKYAKNFHQRCQRMVFIFTNFIDKIVQKVHGLGIFTFCMRDVQHVGDRGPQNCCLL